MKEGRLEHIEQYWEKIRNLEKKLFPEFKESDIYAPENNNNFYFSPSWHFRLGLMTELDIKNIISNNLKLLSVGSGAAYLEIMLVDLGVKKDNITISDVDLKNMPKDFKSVTLNMYGQWDSLNEEKYDLIIFPESTLFNVNFNTDQEKQKGLHHLIIESFSHLNPGGEVRIQHNLIKDFHINPVKDELLNKYDNMQIEDTDKLVIIKKDQI